MYSLSTPLAAVKGIGETTVNNVSKKGITTVLDLLLTVPLAYEDRSEFTTIAAIIPEQLVTLKVTLSAVTNFFKGRGKSIQTAKASDPTGSIKLMWFNNHHVLKTIKPNQEYFVSGKLSARYKTITQPVLEKVATETIHTNRLVPRYTSVLGLPQGKLRRILKEILTNLSLPTDEIAQLAKYPTLTDALSTLHFPASQESVIKARERLALEEILMLIKTSVTIKATWRTHHTPQKLQLPTNFNLGSIPAIIPAQLPFALTKAQKQATYEIMQDIGAATPMNRLLIGDVGSGKTVVAGSACAILAEQGMHSVVIAPTRILAQQHAQTLQTLFPRVRVVLITAGTSKKIVTADSPTLYVGTHAVIPLLKTISPALIIYDEQHRFGVAQRSEALQLSYMPHVLTMTATPIPRSLMLTIFSHLAVSVLDELPAGRKITKTWYIPQTKREDSLSWVAQQLQLNKQQAIVVCPFIDPSEHEALENIAAVTAVFEELEQFYKTTSTPIRLGLLHGKLNKKTQETVVEALYAQKIDLLVTTPMVEVGLDLPKATIIAIEAAERFGLASLHQLRGRVGRAGQQGYCLLFSKSGGVASKKRLAAFCEEHNGLKLAELDLKNRGSGTIFGTTQHGFSDLMFADWANLELLATAKKTFEQLSPDWESILQESTQNKKLPLAN